MREDIITLSVVNFRPIWGNKESNLNRIKGYAKAAARQGSDMVIFPEMCLTGYDNEPEIEKPQKMQSRLAETIPGSTTNELSQIAQDLDIYIIVGMPERDSNNSDIIYNSAAICSPDGTIRKYRKMHLPLDESDWANRGDEAVLFDTKWGLVGVGICYDTYHFPELVSYSRGKGARLFVNCTACCREAVRNPSAQLLLESNVIRENIFVASANLCGVDKYSYFLGGSSIIGPSNDKGGVHFFAGKGFFDKKAYEEVMDTATIDLALSEKNLDVCKFVHNERVGTPDFRPEIYSRLYGELAESEEWKSKTYE